MSESENNSRISGIEKNVSIIQREHELQVRIFDKLEQTVDRLQGLTESVNKILAIHDEKLRTQEKEMDSIKNSMDISRSDCMKCNKLLSDKIEFLGSHVDKLEIKWAEREISQLEKQSNKEVKQADVISRISSKLNDWKIFVYGALFVLGLLTNKLGLLHYLGTLIN